MSKLGDWKKKLNIESVSDNRIFKILLIKSPGLQWQVTEKKTKRSTRENFFYSQREIILEGISDLEQASCADTFFYTLEVDDHMGLHSEIIIESFEIRESAKRALWVKGSSVFCCILWDMFVCINYKMELRWFTVLLAFDCYFTLVLTTEVSSFRFMVVCHVLTIIGLGPSAVKL